MRLRCDDVESSRCLTDSLYGDECESHGGQSSKHGDPDCGGEGLQEREQGPGGALMDIDRYYLNIDEDEEIIA